MKKELLAAIFLAVILICCVINIYCISSLTNELIILVDDADKEAAAENWSVAAEKAESTLNLWEKNHVYLSIVLPNDSLEIITESLHELQKEIEAEDNASVSRAAQLAVTRLEKAASMEQVSFESVF